MTRVLIAVLLLALPVASTHAQATTVLVVRHAERAAEPQGDPVLTEAGARRAEDLLAAVGSAGVTHVLTTTLQRTRLTAAPTATALGITPVAIEVRSAQHVRDVVDSVRARAGGVVLVVGHSNTVPAIVNALGGRAPEMCDAEYDNLYVVTLADTGGPARVVRARYGQPTPVEPGCADRP